MPRFIIEADYLGYIKPEIKEKLTATTGGTPSAAQVRAEDTAIATITEYIGGRYDCATIFDANQNVDSRNKFMVAIVIKLALYDLYHQTGVKDVPEHRKVEYDDTIQWLKDAGRGTIKTTLPILEAEGQINEIWYSSKKPRRNKW